MHTDEFSSYLWLDSSEFTHGTVKHSETYVNGNIHINGVENVWSLFKRGIMGIFHKVSANYLPLYLHEFSFRFNNRARFAFKNLWMEVVPVFSQPMWSQQVERAGGIRVFLGFGLICSGEQAVS